MSATSKATILRHRQEKGSRQWRPGKGKREVRAAIADFTALRHVHEQGFFGNVSLTVGERGSGKSLRAMQLLIEESKRNPAAHFDLAMTPKEFAKLAKRYAEENRYRS